jgi:hypothetical protein
MRDRVPSFFMLVPGPWSEVRELVKALNQRGLSVKHDDPGPIQAGEIHVELVEDDRLAAAFSWGRQGKLPAELLSRIGGCARAALVQCGRRLDEDPARVAGVGRALRDAGGLAIRMEASGAASPWEPWLERLESGDLNRVYATAVLVVQDDGGVMFTCGMHHFDSPDAQIAMDDPRAAIEWLDSFCVYQLAEAPALASGHTFAPHPDATRRAFDRWPDHRHHPNDGRHNPFGLWRFREPGAVGIRGGKLVPTIIPPLVSLLAAAERSRGMPLTKRELEELVASSPAIAMEPRRALAVERSRGYADIEPELAWEQWQIVRQSIEPTPA